MPLVFLPDIETLFLWGESSPPLPLPPGEPWTTTLVCPGGLRDVEGVKLPLSQTVSQLAVVPAAQLESLPASFATWALASKLACALVAREQVAPTVIQRSTHVEARWAAALTGSEDATNVAALAKSMSPAAHAIPAGGPRSTNAVWAPDVLLRAYLDAVVDALVRAAAVVPQQKVNSAAAKDASWTYRLQAALRSPAHKFETRGFAERSLVDDLSRWSLPALGSRDRLRACFRLELPAGEAEVFCLRFLLQSPDDLSVLVSASDVWKGKGDRFEALGRAFRNPQESLLEALGRAARLFSPLESCLEEARPESVALPASAAWTFLGEGAAALSAAGFGVIVPGELTATGHRRLRLRMRVGGGTKTVAGVVAGVAGLSLDGLLEVDWDAVLGDEPLTKAELAALARQKAPLVQFRGAWIAIDPSELGEIQRRLADGTAHLPAREALQAVLLGETRHGELSVAVSASGSVATLIASLQRGAAKKRSAPRSLNATLRPYQERGLNWLLTMGSLGLGACLADDMGLGKTIQLLAFLLQRLEDAPNDIRPALLVAPTSVVGNWEREVERFAPSLHIVRHYGPERAETAGAIPSKPGTVVLTTYGLLRRDADLLSSIEWSVAALDEAQNIKNSSSRAAQAARRLRASHRFALTGTPVENRLSELWSILEFANPGLLGPLAMFRRNFALPIERYGNEDAATRLRRVVSPFILRRLKSDRTIIQDLPAKNEMNVVCTLTREQATLYKAVVDEELRRIDSSEGTERRGRVLALLTFTKQICNHPAQYLGETGPLPRRSGKLARTTEMIDEAMASGDKVLVFTQFREMGDKLLAHFTEIFKGEVLFLHGGTSKAARDAMVQRFTQEPQGPRIFVLSLKAGGTGLNLTAASHVFHYDRWLNPAVEDQATDRAYRIGQKRAVQVHKLLCAGTVEEKISQLLEQKRKLAAKVVGTGEQWITELKTSELRDLFSLSENAVSESDEEDDVNAPIESFKPSGKKPAKRNRREVRQ